MPTLPCVLERLRRVLADPNSNNTSLVAVLACDPALATRVLRVSNSAYYVPQKSCDLQKSVAQLGFGTISQALKNVAVCKTFEDDKLGRFDRAEFWRHSIAVAVITRAIAMQSGSMSPAEAYTCGLLHDIGKLVFDQYLHAEFAKALANAAAGRKPLVMAEKETTQLDHTMIGEMGAKNWHLTPTALAAIRWHHTELADRKGLGATDELIVDIVRVADALAHEIGYGGSGDGAPPEWTPSLTERLPLSEGAIDRIRQSAGAEIDRAAQSVDLPRRTVTTP
ncbi:MAG: HDOD domain-containing protein [bacterium]